ncbi:MAG: type II secretion system F family protein [Actinomycetota bacterium]
MLEGENAQSVANRLRSMGLTPINVTERNRGLQMEITLRPGHVAIKDIAIFCRQFATMVNAGLPVLRCVAVLADQTESAELAKVLRRVRTDVEQGSSLAIALGRHPKTFSNLFIAMVRTGEATGALGEVLEEMAKQIESEVTLRGKIRSAMTYPIAVVGLVLVILSAMLLIVVPQFRTIYAELGAELPLPTRILLAVSAAFQSFWWIFILLVVGATVWVRRWIRTPQGRAAFDALKIRLPLIGPLFHKVAIARFANTFSLLLRSGVPVLQGLDVVKETVNNAVVSKALEEVKGSVREGESISRPLARHPVFPAMVVQMMSVGEDSGSVDTMMAKVATFYNEEVSASVDGLTALIEPALIVTIGVVVGISVISLYLPMFNIINLIQ